jgi:hypothetical protein
MPYEQSPHNSPLTVLVDDVRGFKDQRPALVARSSPEVLRLPDELESERVDHRGLTTIWAERTRSVPSSTCSSTARGPGLKMDVVLRAAGYPVVRSCALTMWTRWF